MKVAIFLPGWVGDAVMATPALRALRQRFGRGWLLTDALEPVRGEGGRLLPSPVLDAYNRLAEATGCPPPGQRMELFTTPHDEAAAGAVWQDARFAGRPEVVCLNPGAA